MSDNLGLLSIWVGFDEAYAAQMLDQYLETAIWCEENDDPNERDWHCCEWSDEAMEKARREVFTFLVENKADTIEAGMTASDAGHDLWLTRRHHGTGFWDRNYGDLGDRLTAAANAMGDSGVYLGDDEKLYFI